MLARQHVLQMQEAYDAAHTRVHLDHLSENEAARRIAAEAAEAPKKKENLVYGDDGFTYPHPEEPDAREFNKAIRAKIEAKYQTLSKNLLYYLSYVSLELTDYAGCIKHGQDLLQRNLALTVKTETSLKQYLAEAYSMVGNFDSALRMLTDVKDCQLSVNSVAKQISLPEQMSSKTVQVMNKAAIKLCQ